ncbi:MAG: RNA methyltransferase [Patescibacteria group bacterium]|nr:RNA methyltransferase [Patescibacteria group bacterium]MDE2438371.1 RNA methyltransferase [Patescibacteria group bacterium]
MIVILDNIRSIHNVGSIFRTADAAGVEKIYCCGITPLPVDRFQNPDPRFIKVSLGAEEFVPWEHVPNIARLVARLQKDGISVIVLEQGKRSISLFDYVPLDPQRPCALVVGNEVSGVSQSVRMRADMMLEIPMRGKKESLNVSVAFGIAVFALCMRTQ